MNMLACIASQLSRQNQQCLDKLKNYYELCNPEDGMPSLPDVSHLEDLIQEMATHFDEVAILVDGLDECGKWTDHITNLLVRLVDSVPNMKTLLSSRDEPHIRDVLNECAQISIAARSSDLKLYVTAELELRIRSNKLRIKSLQLREHIEETLVNGAEGM